MRWLLALSLVGCISGPGEDTLPERDFERFEAMAQPVLAETCATPSCHGRPERPLSIYAPLRYRADPSRLMFDEPLTPEELDDNYQRTRAFLDDVDPERSLLLCKPLAAAAGGCEHEGDEAFADETDRGFAALRAWVVEAEPRQ